jgi:excisionase family DNA binding protein
MSSSISDRVWPTIAQAAEQYQASTQTIRRRIADGTLAARRFGPRLIRIEPESLRAWGSPLQYVEAS